jgi:hypothetical protein
MELVKIRASQINGCAHWNRIQVGLRASHPVEKREAA